MSVYWSVGLLVGLSVCQNFLAGNFLIQTVIYESKIRILLIISVFDGLRGVCGLFRYEATTIGYFVRPLVYMSYICSFVKSV